MSEPAAWDALFVLHARSDPARIGALVRRLRLDRILVLSSHLVFPHERAAFADHAPSGVTFEFTTFAAQLDDASMAELDAATTRALTARPPGLGRYTDHYEHRCRFLKNALLLARLRAQHTWNHAWVDHGLGVHAPVWVATGARYLSWRSLAARLRDLPVLGALAGLPNLWRLPRTATVVRDGEDAYVFISTTRRLRFRPGTPSSTLPTGEALSLPHRILVSTTIHDHPVAVARLRAPVRVFADGYLPPNYPRSYIDAYGAATFVSAEPLAARWFAACARPVAPAPTFLICPPFAPAIAPHAITTVVVLLGHAGDWTALVNRSDNDALVAATLAVARLAPLFKFVLRPHPTMEHPRHEGSGARARLAAHVASAALPNVRFSTGDLATDLAASELLVSEYSATLIDSWRDGKLGVIANLTGRRSFMQEFAALGFPSASTAEELRAALFIAAADPAAFADRQTTAATGYNALLAP